MPVSDEYLEFVAEQLGMIGEVTTKKMFGGAGIYHDGLFFALVANDMIPIFLIMKKQEWNHSNHSITNP